MTRNDEVPQEVGHALQFLERGISGKGIAAEVRTRYATTIRTELTTLRAKLEAAEGEVARLREDAEKWRAFVVRVDAEQAVAASEKFGDALGVLRDARRYRWLRGGPGYLAGQPCAYQFLPGDQEYPTPIGDEALDAAIDAALQEHTP